MAIIATWSSTYEPTQINPIFHDDWGICSILCHLLFQSISSHSFPLTYNPFYFWHWFYFATHNLDRLWYSKYITKIKIKPLTRLESLFRPETSPSICAKCDNQYIRMFRNYKPQCFTILFWMVTSFGQFYVVTTKNIK